MLWIVKTEAMNLDGESESREFMQEGELKDVMHLILQDEGRVAYSSITITNYDK